MHPDGKMPRSHETSTYKKEGIFSTRSTTAAAAAAAAAFLAAPDVDRVSLRSVL
jgi:hypothetical protein